MNSALFTDPVVLILSGVILIAVPALVWGIGKFKRLGSGSLDTNAVDDMLGTSPELPDIEFKSPEPLMREQVSREPVSSPRAVSKEVADRLETMSSRLSEMQTVLMKQSSAPGAGAAGAGGAVGQGFSPETIDKLLKIIGNVMQQVDILQKSLDVTK